MVFYYNYRRPIETLVKMHTQKIIDRLKPKRTMESNIEAFVNLCDENGSVMKATRMGQSIV